MSTITDSARALLATCSSLTGTRATGTVTVTASSSDVTVPRSIYAIPIINGRRRSDLTMKVDTGPNDDESWTATSTGTAITFISNIGGARMNIADGTVLQFDPPLAGIDTLVADGAFTTGADSSGFGALADAVIFEQIDGGDFALDLRRSSIKGFPAVIVAWQSSEPSDGSSTTHNRRETRASNNVVIYRELFQVAIITSKTESDHSRREEGLTIMDNVTSLLTDRHSVDGCAFSNPSGIQIVSRSREDGPQDIYKKFYIYNLIVSVMTSYKRTDARTYNDWLLARIDNIKPQDPEIAGQGDYTVVDDMDVDMS